MEMKVGLKLLVPGMQNGHEPQFATQSVFRLKAKAEQGFGYGAEEDIEHDLLVAQDDRVEGVGQGKDGMEIEG